MVALFLLLLFSAAMLAVILAVAIGIGALLHWMLPVVGLDAAVLVAILAIGITVFILLQFRVALTEVGELGIDGESDA